MKAKYFSILFLAVSFILVENVHSQMDSNEFKPFYITVRTLHGTEGSDMYEWKSVEEEYFNKVISKIDLIVSHEVLISYFNTKLREIKIIDVFRNWNDIKIVHEIRDDLIEKAWPKEEERKVFFEKQNSFYSNFHSDEIYTSTKYAKYLSTELKKANKRPFVYYEKTSILSDYDQKDSYESYEKYVKNVIYKNASIRAYHSYRHFWGADSREFIEVFVVNSIVDLEDALKTNEELLVSFVPDKSKRKDFLQIFEKAILDQSDAVYKNIPSLSK